VFAHFGSREDLQLEVLKLYHRRFEQDVFYPSIKEPRGLPRLRAMFAHFGSREDLQMEVLKLYHHRFEQEVFYPSVQEPRGMPRLKAMFAGWIRQVSVEIASGCIYISGAVEYDDRPGPIREELVSMVRAWQGALLRCVQQTIEVGDLKADTDAQQLVYELYGLILALHHDARFLRMPASAERARAGFERLMRDYQNTPQNPPQNTQH
jgi:AcrR family transcriptional regulator